MPNHRDTIEDALVLARRDTVMRYNKIVDAPTRLTRIDAALAFMRQQGQPLDMPDGPGWWAFEGHLFDPTPVSQLYRTPVQAFSRNGTLYVTFPQIGSWDVSHLKGKWYRVYLPWDAPQEADNG